MLSWMVEKLGKAKGPHEENDKLHLASEGPAAIPAARAAPAPRNYWDLSDDEDDAPAAGSADAAADRFRMGELCRALFHGDDCFYDAEIVGVDHSKKRYDVRFAKNGTLQDRTPAEELQRSHVPRQPRRAGRGSRPPLLQPGDGCRAVLAADDTFYAAEVTKVKGAAAVEVRFSEGPASGALQTTSMSDVQLSLAEAERRMHAAAHGLSAAAAAPSSPGSQASPHPRDAQLQAQASPQRRAPDTLWRAARRGDGEAVSRFLLRDRVEVDAAEPAANGPAGTRTALFYAAEQGHLDVLKRLLQAGAQDVGGHALVRASPAAREFLGSYGFGKAPRGAQVVVQRHEREQSRRNRGHVEAVRVVSGGAHAGAGAGAAAGQELDAATAQRREERRRRREERHRRRRERVANMRAKMRALSSATRGSQAPGLAKLLCRRGAGGEDEYAGAARAREDSGDDEYTDDGEYSAITDEEETTFK